jgi:hypothetical protein
MMILSRLVPNLRLLVNETVGKYMTPIPFLTSHRVLSVCLYWISRYLFTDLIYIYTEAGVPPLLT